MTIIHDDDGNEIADIELSEKQCKLLEAGENVVLIYHTPRMLQYLLGEQSGTFLLSKQRTQIVASDIDVMRKFVNLQRAIKLARENPNASK